MHPRQLKIAQALAKADLSRATIIPIDDHYYRTVNYRRSKEPLSTFGAEKTGGRYNFRPLADNSVPCLYCGEEDTTATTEKFYGLKRNKKPLPPHTVVSVKVKLCQVLDLTSHRKCELVGIDWDLINGEWQYCQDVLEIASYSQEIGRLVYESISPPLEGVKFASTKHPGKNNLAIFPDKLNPDSMIKLYDPKGDFS